MLAPKDLRRRRWWGRAVAVLSLLGYCAFFAVPMAPAWMEVWTESKPSFYGTVIERFVLGAQVIPCLVLAGIAFVPRLTELATAIAACIVLSFGVVVALVEPAWGLPSFATITLLMLALVIGRWPLSRASDAQPARVGAIGLPALAVPVRRRQGQTERRGERRHIEAVVFARVVVGVKSKLKRGRPASDDPPTDLALGIQTPDRVVERLPIEPGLYARPRGIPDDRVKVDLARGAPQDEPSRTFIDGQGVAKRP